MTFGGLEYNIAFVRNISDRKHVEQELYEQKELLAKTQEIAHVGSWLFDPATSGLTWSDETYRMFGLRPGERSITHDDFVDAVHSDDRKAVLAAYSNSLQQQHHTYDIEHRIVRKIPAKYEPCVKSACMNSTVPEWSCDPSAWSKTSPKNGGQKRNSGTAGNSSPKSSQCLLPPW